MTTNETLKDYLLNKFKKNKPISGYEVEEIYQHCKEKIWKLINDLASVLGLTIFEFIRTYFEGLDEIKCEIDLHGVFVMFAANYYLKKKTTNKHKYYYQLTCMAELNTEQTKQKKR